jgi:predicted phosphoribosyltransferase
MSRPFRDRRDAGKKLAAMLIPKYGHRSDVVILALPRGGVPVAVEIGEALHALLEPFVVRALGVPSHEKLRATRPPAAESKGSRRKKGRGSLRMGVVASDGICVVDREMIDALAIPTAAVDRTIALEMREVQKRDAVYRRAAPLSPLEDKTVILTDDGRASTRGKMLAAISALRSKRPARVVVAVPVASAESFARIDREVDEIVCATTPVLFRGVAQWFEEFSRMSVKEVMDLLDEAKARPMSAVV